MVPSLVGEPSSFSLRVPSPGELWSSDHRPVYEDTQPLILPQLLSTEEIQELISSAGPAYPPRQHRMLRGTFTGPAAVHDVAESDTHFKLYLHRGGHFQREWPELCARLLAAMTGQAGYPCSGEAPDELSVRVVEFHTYHANGGLMARGHRDRGSVLTLSVMLSSDDDCDGGEFITWTMNGTVPISHKLGRGDAILFHSEKTHNVATVARGTRYSLVIELWRLPDAREGAENIFDRDC